MGPAHSWPKTPTWFLEHPGQQKAARAPRRLCQCPSSLHWPQAGQGTALGGWVVSPSRPPLGCCNDHFRDEVNTFNPDTLVADSQHKGKQVIGAPSLMSLPPHLRKPTSLQQCEVVIRQLWNANVLQTQEVRLERRWVSGGQRPWCLCSLGHHASSCLSAAAPQVPPRGDPEAQGCPGRGQPKYFQVSAWGALTQTWRA